MGSVSTGNPALDEHLGGGLPRGELTNIVSTPTMGSRRRLLCSIAEANPGSVFVNANGSLMFPDSKKAHIADTEGDIMTSVLTAFHYGVPVVVVDPVCFRVDSNEVAGKARRTQRLLEAYHRKFAEVTTLVFGWDLYADQYLPKASEYSACLSLRMMDSPFPRVQVLKNKDDLCSIPNGTLIELPGLWGPLGQAPQTFPKNRFDLMEDM